MLVFFFFPVFLWGLIFAACKETYSCICPKNALLRMSLLLWQAAWDNTGMFASQDFIGSEFYYSSYSGVSYTLNNFTLLY